MYSRYPWSDTLSLTPTGQVQDVGLIFLSAIASSVVEACTGAGVSPENTLATVLAAITSATGIVGILIIGTGLRAAQTCGGAEPGLRVSPAAPFA